jgi:hypothetical protein
MQMRDAWKGAAAGPSSADTYGEGDDEDEALDPGAAPEGVSEADLERARWIDRMTNAWKEPVSTWRGASPGQTPGLPSYPGPSGPARSDYAESAWSAQRAIKPGSPGAADQVERYRRRLSGETADAGDDRARAYAEYCDRISTDWMR